MVRIAKYKVAGLTVVALIGATVLAITNQLWPAMTLSALNGILLLYVTGNLSRHFGAEWPRDSAGRKIGVTAVALVCQVVYAVAVGAGLGVLPGLIATLTIGTVGRVAESKMWELDE